MSAGRTVTVEQADTSFRFYDADQLLIEVTRTTTKTIARYKARKPEAPARRPVSIESRSTARVMTGTVTP